MTFQTELTVICLVGISRLLEEPVPLCFSSGKFPDRFLKSKKKDLLFNIHKKNLCIILFSCKVQSFPTFQDKTRQKKKKSVFLIKDKRMSFHFVSQSRKFNLIYFLGNCLWIADTVVKSLHRNTALSLC